MTFRIQRVTARLFLTILLNLGDSSFLSCDTVLSFRKIPTFQTTLLHLTLIPWNCGQQVLWKSSCIMHGVTSQKTVQFHVVRTSVLGLALEEGYDVESENLLITDSLDYHAGNSSPLPLWHTKTFHVWTSLFRLYWWRVDVAIEWSLLLRSI